MTSGFQTADYINLHLGIPEERFDAAIGIIANLPILGVEERFDELVISFSAEDYRSIPPQMLKELLEKNDIPAEILRIDPIKAQNWNIEFEKSLRPVIVSNRIVIAPSWEEDVPQAEIIIRIDPKMSFGTGYHPTTRMVCRFVEKYAQPGTYWIDAGAGTGIIGILATKLGASGVFAFDNDDWAVDNCNENIELNCVGDKMKCKKADVFTVELPYADGIAANLYRNLIVPIFPRFRKALPRKRSILLVSGILVYDKEEVCEAAENAGFKMLEVETEGEWIAAAFETK